MAEYANPDVLVDTDWLEQHIEDDSVAIIEVDEDIHGLREGPHPERDRRSTGRASCTTCPGASSSRPSSSRQLLGEKGISSDQTIVLYSGNNNWFAAYAYWLFKYRGVENVKLLNGGRKKWELESRLLTPDLPEPLRSDVRDRLRAARAPRSSATRSSSVRKAETAHGSTFARPRSSAASCSHRRTFRRSRRRCPVTSRAPRTSRGPRP